VHYAAERFDSPLRDSAERFDSPWNLEQNASHCKGHGR
jgi:hypothetical protein